MAIDEGLFVSINGQDQWITIRGRDLRNPVLLMLHGGPGFPMSFMAPAFAEWEKRFTLVQWDQPGGGATWSKNEANPGPLTYARFVDDGIAVTEWICKRLNTRKITLLGNSWGTCLGVMMIQKRPHLFAAYVGTSQVVSGPEGDKVGYELGLQSARDRADAKAVAALEEVGPPPYATFEQFLVRQTYTNPPGAPPSAAEAAASVAFGKLMMTAPPADAHYIAHGLPPYDGGKVFLQTQAAVFKEARAWQAKAYGEDFKVPVFVFQGDQDLNTPFVLARDWVARIHAPKKGFAAIEGCGHNTMVFQDRILELLERDVRPLVATTAAPA
jgi:pimeloyl-ACP methyl ester carboxylesterase